MVYYRRKKVSKSRGWMARNMRRAGSALKKRYTTKGKLSLAKVASDAKYALSIAKTAQGLLNTEKKRYEINLWDQFVGQVNQNASGHYVTELTPAPSQGTGMGGRIGSSISLRSMFIKIQVQEEANTLSNCNIKFMLVQTQDGDAFDIAKFLQYNAYLYARNSVAIYDNVSQRDPDYFHDFKVLRTKVIKFGMNTFNNVKQQKTFNFSINFGRNGKHIRFNDNTSTSANSRLYLLALADTGNTNGGAASTLSGILNTGVDTAYMLQLQSCSYFIDN